MCSGWCRCLSSFPFSIFITSRWGMRGSEIVLTQEMIMVFWIVYRPACVSHIGSLWALLTSGGGLTHWVGLHGITQCFHYYGTFKKQTITFVSLLSSPKELKVAYCGILRDLVARLSDLLQTSLLFSPMWRSSLTLFWLNLPFAFFCVF